MIVLHLIVYVFFIISFLFLLVANIVSNAQVLSACNFLVAIANLISEIILLFIFNSIFSNRVTKAKTVKIDGLPQYSENLIDISESSSDETSF